MCINAQHLLVMILFVKTLMCLSHLFALTVHVLNMEYRNKAVRIVNSRVIADIEFELIMI